MDAGQVMDLEELKQALDQLAWREQVEFEIGEKYPGRADDTELLADLDRLGGRIRPDLVDRLERSPGYVAWALRLSASVPGDESRARALRHLDSADGEVRYWAQRLLDSIGA